MKFNPIPRVYATQALYYAATGKFTFIISKDEDEAESYYASVKHRSATMFDGTRHDLGLFDSFVEAEKACRQFAKSNRHEQ